ncbi:hypothetical protein [Pseudoalteromonas rubra]|uniref:hypothetical protein n=1 Tax=Pseudoalteromonas rubra TaxID=43658 RepID=UPI000F78EC23|nr:hypothetical protein [Pseudoalteromonas rubra]
MTTLSQKIAELIDENANLVAGAQLLTNEVNSQLGLIDTALNSVPDTAINAIKSHLETELYVNADPNIGSDNYDGKTPEQPLQTLTEACRRLTAGCSARIKLAANEKTHYFSGVILPDCNVQFEAYTQTDWLHYGLKLHCTGAVAFNTRGINTRIALQFDGDFEKHITLEHNRLFENIGRANYSLSSSNDFYPVIVLYGGEGALFPHFVAVNYSRFAGVGTVAMQNVTFAADVSMVNGERSFTYMPQFRADISPTGGGILAFYRNVEVYAEQFTPPDTELAPGCYLITQTSPDNSWLVHNKPSQP